MQLGSNIILKINNYESLNNLHRKLFITSLLILNPAKNNMNNLLFYALLMVLLYYFFIYLPNQKKSQANNRPLPHHQATQTEPIIWNKEPNSTDTLNGPGAIFNCPSPQFKVDPEEIKKLQKDISQKERTIIGLNNSYSKLETKSQQELDNLKKQLQIKDAKLKELAEAETSLDQMIKNIKELNEEIEK